MSTSSESQFLARPIRHSARFRAARKKTAGTREMQNTEASRARAIDRAARKVGSPIARHFHGPPTKHLSSAIVAAASVSADASVRVAISCFVSQSAGGWPVNSSSTDRPSEFYDRSLGKISLRRSFVYCPVPLFSPRRSAATVVRIITIIILVTVNSLKSILRVAGFLEPPVTVPVGELRGSGNLPRSGARLRWPRDPPSRWIAASSYGAFTPSVRLWRGSLGVVGELCVSDAEESLRFSPQRLFPKSN